MCLRQTLTLPKPLVEFGNKPMILHQIQALAAAGVTDIVLAVNYRPEIMTEALKKVCTTPPRHTNLNSDSPPIPTVREGIQRAH
jgi:NDP-sugar pyrophosphorylase family protein